MVLSYLPREVLVLSFVSFSFSWEEEGDCHLSRCGGQGREVPPLWDLLLFVPLLVLRLLIMMPFPFLRFPLMGFAVAVLLLLLLLLRLMLFLLLLLLFLVLLAAAVFELEFLVLLVALLVVAQHHVWKDPNHLQQE